MKFRSAGLGLAVLALVMLATPAMADPIVVGPGAFSGPVPIDFENFLYVGQVPINNQYSGLGITFSNFWSDPGDGYLFTGGGLVAAANFNPGVGCQGHCQASDIFLSLPYTLVGFQIFANLNVVDVTVTTGTGTFDFTFAPAWNIFIGFYDPSGIQSIHIDPNLGDPNRNVAMTIDNVRFQGEATVPEPSSILLAGSGTLWLLGGVRRKLSA